MLRLRLFFATLYVMQNTVYDVIIVGAGASGLICARECARGGLKTLVLEKEQTPGRKILVTGNGRCNLTNVRVAPAFYNADKKLISAALAHFSYADCRRYFEDLGILLTEEGQGRIFPQTGKSTAVLEPLKLAVLESGAEILTGQTVTQIKRGKTFNLTTQSAQTFQARHVVLACGSCAYPQAGGTISGYELAQKLGHTIHTPRPTLSGLMLKENLSRLSGIRAQVKLTAHTSPDVQTQGEIIFTGYGINGPAALNASGAISRALTNGNVNLHLNFLPEIQNAEKFFSERLERFSSRRPKDFFAGVLHESIANLLIDFKGLRKNKPMSEQSPSAVKSAFETITAWPVTVTALRPWNEAMAAAGGVNTHEINYNTFESLRCPGLYITGELLDVDGQSGGFNLHFAWASGFSAAEDLTKENTPYGRNYSENH